MMKKRKTPRYVADIPYSKRLQLCKILDGDGEWRNLAAELNFETDDINLWAMAIQQPGGSPTDRVLTRYSHANPTIKDLFYKLKSLCNVRAMNTLKGLVPDELFKDLSGTESRIVAGPVVEEDDTTELPGPPLPPSLSKFLLPEQFTTPGFSVGKLPVQVASLSSSNSKSSSLSGIDLHSPEKEHSFIYSDKEVPSIHQKGSDQIPHMQPPFSDASIQPVVPLSLQNEKRKIQVDTLQSLPHFKYKDLILATNNFSQKNVLGNGGFGTVYKGQFDQALVAIKTLNRRSDENKDDDLIMNKRHFAEIKAVLEYKHPNIIQILGYSLDGPFVCLVHHYMANGSLDKRLACVNANPPLTWTQRQNILIGSARGIHFLHTSQEKPMIHGDIKSANILLDATLQAKIADFGLAHLATGGTNGYTHASRSDMEGKVFGSEAYLPPEFARVPKHSLASDTFGFGIVVYEVCTGERAHDARREGGHKLKDFVVSVLLTKDDSKILEIRDQRAPDWPHKVWRQTLDVGTQCTDTKTKRPKMGEVLSALETITYGVNTSVAPSDASIGHLQSFNLHHISHNDQISLAAQNQPGLTYGQQQLLKSLQDLGMKNNDLYKSDPHKLALMEQFDEANMEFYQPQRPPVETNQDREAYQLQLEYDIRHESMKSKCDGHPSMGHMASGTDPKKLDAFRSLPLKGQGAQPHVYADVPGEITEKESLQNELDPCQEETTRCLFDDEDTLEMIQQKRQQPMPGFLDELIKSSSKP